MNCSKNRKLFQPGNGGESSANTKLTDVLLLKPHSGLKPTLLNRLKAEVQFQTPVRSASFSPFFPPLILILCFDFLLRTFTMEALGANLHRGLGESRRCQAQLSVQLPPLLIRGLGRRTMEALLLENVSEK